MDLMEGGQILFHIPLECESDELFISVSQSSRSESEKNKLSDSHQLLHVNTWTHEHMNTWTHHHEHQSMPAADNTATT